ncbi:MAG: helix-turn-helix domain-containing protein [Vicinamibacteria bacterium]
MQRKLRENAGTVSKTAEALNLERSNLYRKMKSYGIAPYKTEDGD